jgi:alpha-D-xyloside xylohydrolase
MMRPLVMDFRDDDATRKIGDQFLFGPSILVNPVTHPGVQQRAVYLPKGTRWFDFWTGKSFDGGEIIQASAPITNMPLYIRAGSIIPYGPLAHWATEKVDAPIEIRIYPGTNDEFTLYEDEGDNYNYEQGAHATIPLQWNEATKTLTIGSRSGSYTGMPNERVFKIVYVSQNHGAGIASTENVDRTVTYRGFAIQIPVCGNECQ